MDIEEGKKYLCINTVIMDEDNDIAYIKGKVYKSEQSNCITDEGGDIYHHWFRDSNPEKFFELYEDSIESSRINHPSHYTWLKEKCGIEVIDITRHLDFDTGNIIKYLLRAGHKFEEGYSDIEKELEDLKKAEWYLKDRIKTLEIELRLKNVKQNKV